MFWKEAHEQRRFSIKGISPHVVKFINDVATSRVVNGKPIKILETGAGCGRNIQYAKKILGNGADSLAVDISESALSQIVCSQIEKLVADMRDCPVKTGSITHAISWRTLHCLDAKGRDEALEEKRRILNHQGELLLAVRSNHNIYYGCGEQTEKGSFVISCQKDMPPGLKFHGKLSPNSWHYFYPEELTNLLEKHGFSISSINHLTELPGTFKYPGYKNSYWGVRAKRENNAQLWTGVSFV